MIKLWIVLAALALVYSPETAPAQQTTDEKRLLAAGPTFMHIMPESAQWSIDYNYSAKAANFEGIRPKRIVITKKGEIRHEEKIYENGITGDMWRMGHMEIERRSNRPKLMTKVVSNEVRNDFPELEWISSKNFAGIQTSNDRKCFVFHEERFNEVHTPLGTATALIDVETRYPVAYHFQSQTLRYTILPPPSAPLTIPEEFAKRGKAMLDHIYKTTPHLSAP